MEDCHDNHPAGYPSGFPSSVMLALESMTTSQAAYEAAANFAQAVTRPKGVIWIHYDRIPDRDRKNMVKCRYCDQKYVCTNYGTGNMWKHLRKAHPEKIGDQKPGPGSFGAVLTPAALRKALVEWIVDRD